MDDLSIATAIIKQCEGCRLEPYEDVRDLWTIGFGNRCTVDGSPVTAKTQPLQLYQAEQLLRETLMFSTEPTLKRLITATVTPAQLGACMSLAYNIGTTAFLKSSLLRLLNEGNASQAAQQFDAWVFVSGQRIRGLVYRRALEQGVFEGKIDPATLKPFPLPSAPHPLFASSKASELTTDDLNAQELATLRPIPRAA